jgi:uncharacterized Rmd1/YagE family protein
MNASLPIARTAFKARALLLGERLEPRALADRFERIAATPLAIRTGEYGVAVVFRYGVVVFFDVAHEDELRLVDSIRPHVVGAYASPEVEEIELRVAPGAREAITAGVATIEAPTVERLQLVADVLSKSVVLALYESRVGSTFERIEPFAKQLEDSGRFGASERELLRHIGATLRIDHMMVGRVAVSEKPELLWEHPELEGLFIRLEDEFEIRERHEALERKLGVISGTAEKLLDLIQSRHSLRVEWYIVALIVLEVALTLYQMFR